MRKRNGRFKKKAAADRSGGSVGADGEVRAVPIGRVAGRGHGAIESFGDVSGWTSLKSSEKKRTSEPF